MAVTESPLPATSNLARYKVILAGISALILTVGLARFAYTPLLPIMRDGAGLSDVAGGWLATINYLGYMSGALLASCIGRLSVKFTLYRVCLVLAVVTTLGMGLTDNVVLWAALRFVAGVSSIAGLLLASGLVLNWLTRHHHRQELGLHFTGLGLGIVVSGLALASMIEWTNWAQQWIGLGLLGLVFFVPAWRWLPAPPPISTKQTAKALQGPSRRWLALMIAVYFCGGFGYVVGATFIVAILERLPLLAGEGSWVWVIVGLAAVPSSFLWDRVARALGPVMALLIAYGLQTVSFVLPVVSTATFVNLLSAVLFGGTFVGVVSLTLTLIGSRYPANPARAMSRLTLSYGVAQVVAPAMTGYIVAFTGSYHGALLVTTVVMIAGMGLLLALHRVTPPMPEAG
ncbi:YbfB/YjiJ family MFS transporter [Halomonas sp. McH1-25]|uniref:YbfB/YjiJ family MFS transporter n=1 Tax=unclassified Halomonas TaxID=2609666 RepID=UPI001EF6CDB1|nr:MULTISPECIES: YbfB/YjiJ family MFS transporter [unclassified Halomonas]MCG7599704.1 YbfB/YjiJ family MFS transporter [Halomonas sp. McH1-25]MCP1342788.1 YbfB/YjiJ family MFS transporter [Halomonas sp. FL8]MCP1360858.1 YbfB/YjiJ family MFS transporter [Halomonas sp. BBD45]